MFRTIIAAATLLLASCGPMAAVNSASAPLAGTQADERSIALAFGAAEELTLLSKTARQRGHACCQPGTPSARQNADRLDAIAQYLEAASSAQKLANTGLATMNLREALALIAQVRRVVSPSNTGDLR